MPRWIDMTNAQRSRLDRAVNAKRQRHAADYIAAAVLDVENAKARLAEQPNSKLRARSLSDAESRLFEVRSEFVDDTR